ncbi:MAG: 30S ribosomal protein S4e [Candidatus Geothermarchaeales archaeon]
MKRSMAPSFLPISRKRFKWALKPRPGPHPGDRAVPLGTLLREVLGLAKNMREARYILRQGHVKIDGKPVKDHRFPVGLMDVVELVPLKKFYRMLPTKKRAVQPLEIEEAEKGLKLCMVMKKTVVKAGALQISLHDGRTTLIKEDSPLQDIKTGGAVLYNLEDKALLDYIPLEPGIQALIIGGKRRGLMGEVQGVRHPKKMGPKLVSIKLPSGEVTETTKDYVFPVGKEKPLIKLPTEAVE